MGTTTSSESYEFAEYLRSVRTQTQAEVDAHAALVHDPEARFEACQSHHTPCPSAH